MQEVDESESVAPIHLQDDVVSQLTKLAGVPAGSTEQFRSMMGWALREAHIFAEAPTLRPGQRQRVQVRGFLTSARNAARSLERALAKLQCEGVGNDKVAAAALAGLGLAQAIAGEDPERVARCLGDHRHWAATLIAAVPQAETYVAPLWSAKPGRPKGTGGSLAFDVFVQRVFETARRTGGHWTHMRNTSRDGPEWKGSLSQALRLLRPHLPANFFPKVKLGHALERLATRFGRDPGEIPHSP